MAPERSAPSYLISGASRGLGLEFVNQLLAHPSQPVIVAGARSPSTATSLKALVSQYSGRLHIIQLDTADETSIKAASQWVEQNLGGRLDVLINNAGIGESPSIKWDELTFAEAEDVLRVNVVGPLILSSALLPALRRGNLKRIIQISSRAGSLGSVQAHLLPLLDPSSSVPDKKGIAPLPPTALSIYKASKVALNMESLIIAGDLASEGFTVVAFHPGWVATDMGNLNSTATISPPLTAEQSVAGIVGVLDRLTPSDNGSFLSYDGSNMPW